MAKPKKKPVKKRSDEGRSVRKEDRKIVGKATRRELKKDAKRVVAGASMAIGLTAAGKGIKVAKGTLAAKKAAKAASKSKVPKLAPGQKMPPAPNFGRSPYKEAKIAAEKKKAVEDAAQKAKEKARARSDAAKKGKEEYKKQQMRKEAERDRYGPYGKGPHWNYGGYLT